MLGSTHGQGCTYGLYTDKNPSHIQFNRSEDAYVQLSPLLNLKLILVMNSAEMLIIA